jgi:hypothetical protein
MGSFTPLMLRTVSEARDRAEAIKRKTSGFQWFLLTPFIGYLLPASFLVWLLRSRGPARLDERIPED